VLAVGDYNFQRKCLDRVGELKRQGVTICLVSHAHDAVRDQCVRALWFDRGRLIADGPTESVVKQYLDRGLALDAARLADAGQMQLARWGSRRIEIVRVRLLDGAGCEQALFETFQPFAVQITYQANADLPPPVFGLAIHRQDGLHLAGPNTGFSGFELPPLSGGGVVTYTLPALPLLEGLYYVSVAVHDQEDTETYDYHDRRYPFRVVNGSGRVRERYGLLAFTGQWTHSPRSA
jgi:lipopolysaccharide transport system ATP-binding protein